MVNQDLDIATVRRVERNVLMRQLQAAEGIAAKIRSELDINAGGRTGPADGITRMRTDQIEKLHGNGKITGDHYTAALAIRRIWEALGRGLFPSASPIAGMVSTRGSPKFRQPLERMNEKDLYLWSYFYRPWATKCEKLRAFDQGSRAGGETRSLLTLTHAMVIDNFGPYQLEIKWELPRGKAKVIHELRRALGFFFDEYDPVSAPPLSNIRTYKEFFAAQ